MHIFCTLVQKIYGSGFFVHILCIFILYNKESILRIPNFKQTRCQRMSESIFREQSLNKVKSPDNLNEYIRIANPGVWTLLAAILFLLLGFCLWGIFGQLRTVVQVDAQSSGGVITCRLTDADAAAVQPGMTVLIDGQNATVSEVTVRGGSSTCTIVSPVSLPDGSYTAQIEVETIQPISFLLN